MAQDRFFGHQQRIVASDRDGNLAGHTGLQAGFRVRGIQVDDKGKGLLLSGGRNPTDLQQQVLARKGGAGEFNLLSDLEGSDACFFPRRSAWC